MFNFSCLRIWNFRLKIGQNDRIRVFSLLKFRGLNPWYGWYHISPRSVHLVKLDFFQHKIFQGLHFSTGNAIKDLRAVGNMQWTSFRLESSIRSWEEWSWKSQQFTNFSMFPTLVSNYMSAKEAIYRLNLLNC